MSEAELRRQLSVALAALRKILSLKEAPVSRLPVQIAAEALKEIK